MPPSPRAKQAAARIRQLACLDIGGPQLVPLLLDELHDVFEFDTAGYLHVNAEQQLEAYMQDPDVQAIVPIWLDEHMQRHEREVARNFTDAVRCEFGPQLKEQLMTIPWRQFQRSDYYNVLLRPLSLQDCVSLIPRLPNGGPVGVFKFYRRSELFSFQRTHLAELARLEPFLAQALRSRPEPETGTDTLGSAQLVTAIDGRLLWLSERAAPLLALAFGSRWRARSELPDALKAVLSQLRRIQRGDDTDRLPQLEVRNAAGRFTIAAKLLWAAAGDERTVGFHLEHRIPRPLRALTALRGLALPPRQMTVAYWLAQGLAEPAIAARMGISHNTVVYHRRELYGRLGVGHRHELLGLLLGGAGSA